MLTYKSFIGQDDIKWWDGITRTFTRTTSTGGTVTLNKVGNAVDILQVYGSGSTKTDATMNDAISQIGTNTASIVLTPGIWSIFNNVTIPNNITVIIPQGVLLSIESGKTITFNGDIVAGIYKIFSGLGTATINKNPVIYPEWWGALGDGSTDDSYSIDLAIAAGTGKTIVFTKSTYITDTLTLDETADNLIFMGAGLNTTIKLKASATDAMLKINIGQASSSLFAQNIIFRDIVLDGNKANQVNVAARIVDMFQCKYFEFDNVLFKNAYGDAVRVDTSDGIRFTGANTIFSAIKTTAINIIDCRDVIIDNGVVFDTFTDDDYAVKYTYSDRVLTTPHQALKIDSITANVVFGFLQISQGATPTKGTISLSNISGLDVRRRLVDIVHAYSVHMENIAVYDSTDNAGAYWLYIADAAAITDKVYVKNVTGIKADGTPIRFYDIVGRISFSPEVLIMGHKASTATSGTGADDLKSTTLPAYDGETGAVPMAGHSFNIKAAGTMTNNNDNKTIKLYWGTEVIATLSEINNGFLSAAAKGYDSGDWIIEADVYQVQYDTVRVVVRAYRSENLVLADVVSSVTYDMSSAFTCKVTGECDNGSDVITQFTFDVTKR